ncbi:MAG: MFS transporter, partial [Verrucomicrobiota bacterium]
MIITFKKRIPFHWLVVTIIPWAAWVFVYMVMAVAFMFSLKKFVENPAGLTFVMSLPGIVSIVLGPSVSFISDRIWTRFGRRKPFVITAWTLCGVTVAAMPLMPNFWLLLGAYILFNVGSDLQTTQEPLKQEIIPPAQRGRAVAGVSWMTQLGILMFFAVALGRFDDRMFYLGVPITGEQSIYWAAAAGMLVMTLLICLGIKEVDPKSKVLGEKFNLKNFFRGILNHDLWPVYLLIFGFAMLTTGLGVMGNLLYTDQWHFTKQEMGNNVAIGGIINGPIAAGDMHRVMWGVGGYFYVSYYDTMFGTQGLGAVYPKAEATGNYAGIYQYDPLGACTSLGFGSQTGWFANIFTATKTSSLGAVGFYTAAPGTSYEVYTGSSL